MRHQQILGEWRRALTSLRAAETLNAQGLGEDAISRAYYAVMHAAKAALLVHDAVAESHASVRRLFGLTLIVPGEVEREWADILAREQDERIAADYDVDREPDAAVAERLVGDARRFLERMRRHLASKGVEVERPGGP
jgi:hypothetical protein